MSVTDKQLAFSGITGRNLYTSDTAEAVDISIEDGMLRGRQTDTAIPNVSGNITLSGTAIVAGDFAWGDDVYSCSTGWIKNGTALNLPSKPTLSVGYDLIRKPISSINIAAYHGSTSGNDDYAEIKNGREWWSIWKELNPIETHGVRSQFDPPLDMSKSTTMEAPLQVIVYGSQIVDFNDMKVFINDTEMTTSSVSGSISWDSSKWDHPTSPISSGDWAAHGQQITYTASLSNLETPASVKSIEMRLPIWHKIDQEDGFVVKIPSGFSLASSIGAGDYSYVATLTSGGVEGPISDPVDIVVGSGPYIISAVISGSGTVKLYRATAGTYGLIGSAESSGSVTIQDTGQAITDILRPTTCLPVGLSTIWGNRVVIASGNTIYVSAAGRPTTFAEVPLNDDGLDAYAVTLGEPINCLNVNEALVAYSPNSKYLFSGQTIYKGDRYGQQTPTHSPSIGVVAADGEVELGSDFVVLAGKVEYLPDVFTPSSRVLQRKDIYLLNGTKLYVRKMDVTGWITYTLPFTGVDLEFDGQYAVVSSSGSCIRIANGSSRMTGHWLSGQMSSIGQLRAKWVMIRGSADVTITNQTTSLSKTITDDTWNCSLLPSDSFNIKITPNAVYIATVGYEQTAVRA